MTIEGIDAQKWVLLFTLFILIVWLLEFKNPKG
jgi:hypothetical protein